MQCGRLLVFAVTCYLMTGVSAARAQQQESGFLDRLDHPDRTLHYSPSDKTFTAPSNVTGKPVPIRTFAFGHAANVGAGNGVFQTRSFNGDGKFHTQDYTTRNATASGKGFAQTDKGYATKSMDVKEDRAAGKTMPIHDYVNSEKPYLIRGKRQDEIDELTKEKNLTIDQVRELLNKNK